MNEEKVNKAIEPLIKMYTQIENDLLVKIASHFLINDEFINSDYWRLKKLDELGLLNKETIEYIAKYSKKTQAEVLKALEEIGYKTYNINKLNKIFENGKLKINPQTLIDNYTIKNIIETAYNELTNEFIQMSSKIEQSVRTSYLKVVDRAYIETSTGISSYQEAIRNAIDELGNNGLTALTYRTTDEAGNVIGMRNYDVESAVRREVLTATRQLANNINMKAVEELNCEYLYLSEHIRCRPQHFDWQGTIIKTKDLISITGYGEVDGLCGINCAHYFEPYYGEARNNELKHISKAEATKQYELSQKQRYLERGTRKWQRKEEMFKKNGDVEAYIKSKSKAREWMNKTNQFVEANDLKRDFMREYVKNKKAIN